MAFTKRAWSAARGFPANLYAGEDVAFSRAVHETGVGTALIPRASVLWRPRGGWLATARMYFSYARGDIRTPPRRAHAVRAVGLAIAIALLVLLGPLALIPIAAGLALYLAHPICGPSAHRCPGTSTSGGCRCWSTLKDLANLAGAVVGLVDMLLRRRQPRPGG